VSLTSRKEVWIEEDRSSSRTIGVVPKTAWSLRVDLISCLRVGCGAGKEGFVLVVVADDMARFWFVGD
jgi:hypothetical protein